MNVLNQIRTYTTFDREMKFLIIEAYVQLGWARILKGMPFSKVSPGLGAYMEETTYEPNHHDRKLLKRISEAIHISSRYTFWESQCMVKAIAGMNMLKRREIESTIYFGTGRDEQGKMIAHAWLRSGSIYLSGAEEMNRFIIVGKYAKKIYS
jgi:hypothetical protein